MMIGSLANGNNFHSRPRLQRRKLNQLKITPLKIVRGVMCDYRMPLRCSLIMVYAVLIWTCAKWLLDMIYRLLFNNTTIGNFNDTTALFSDFKVMSDDDNGMSFFVQFMEYRHYF